VEKSEHQHGNHSHNKSSNNHHGHSCHNHDDNHKNENHSHEHDDHGGGHHDHHAHMVDDFKKRFYISLAVTVPILILSPMIQEFFNFEVTFSGDMLILFLLSTFVFFYGGWPFIKGSADEFKQKNPGMMTLIALAIVVAYLFSSLAVFGLSAKNFYWELATLIDIMLLGHWIEMKSVMGASRALEELVKMMPSEAHLINEKGG
jgi:Cu2+-exporting ATPase